MSSESSGAKFAILGMFAAAVLGAFGYVLWRKDNAQPGAVPSPESPGTTAAAGSTAPPPEVTHVRFLYGTEKKAWLAEALQRFGKDHPEIVVDTVEKGSLDMAQALLDQNERPTLISPADDVALNLLTSDWKQKNGSDLLASDGPDKPQPLVLTPLVLVAWEDRASALSGSEKTLTFSHLRDAIKNPKGWPGVGGKPDWGFVKLGHTNPTRSNSGLQALILIAYEFGKKRSGLEVHDVLDEKFQSFLKDIEKGVPKFGDSTGSFMQEMVLYGPSKYDVVVTYENLAIQYIPSAQGRWGNLRVFYPPQTMWSSHPVALLSGDWVTPAQRAAARQLIAYLRDKPEQQRALALGFRPANPEVPVLSNDTESPFKKAEAFGVHADPGSVVEPPPGPVIRNLMELWNRQIAR
jgi:ABC-type glycerol-3-phosphate transport system substrate-binding protein